MKGPSLCADLSGLCVDRHHRQFGVALRVALSLLCRVAVKSYGFASSIDGHFNAIEETCQRTAAIGLL